MIFSGFGLCCCGSISQYKENLNCPKKSHLVLKIVGLSPLSLHCPRYCRGVLISIACGLPTPRHEMASSLMQGNGVLEHPPVGAAASSTSAAMPAVVVHPAEPDVEPVLPIHMEEV